MILATSENNVQGFIEFELIKLAERINVSGNLVDGQIEFIASQLIVKFPNETIADFKICFERGATGAYGKIYKLDGVEIGIWMSGIEKDGKVIQRGYLHEKYEVMETELMKEKENLWQKSKVNTDWLQLWKDSIAKTDAEGGVKSTTQNSLYANQLRGMTDKEIKEEGQPKPKALNYPSTSQSMIDQHERHIQYVRENYDTYTGEKKATWISEDEWNETPEG